jgi:7-alpha-hydroxysteroid dehydrogenase
MTHRMDGKSAIVTGAANGIGLAIARRLVRAGAHVVMADHDEEKLALEVETLSAEDWDGRAQGVAGDITQKLAMANVLAATLDATDRLDVLVNAARIVPIGDPLDPAGGDIEGVFAVNVAAVLRMSQLAARRMRGDGLARVDGAIVNVSSAYARRAPARLLGYSVVCAGLEQLTRGLAAALAPHGIRVNAIAVGGVPGRSLAEAFPGVDDLPHALADTTPLGRIGDPAEAAEAALYLASPAASFVTGEILTVDGGRGLVDPFDPPDDEP